MFYFDKLAYKGKLTKECLDRFVTLDKKRLLFNRAKSWSIWGHLFYWTDLICTFPEKNIYKSILLFSHWIVSDSLQPHALQHTRFSCPSLSHRVCSNSCPLSWWCYLTISSYASLFSSCLQPFPASGSFPISQLFKSGGQSIGA